MQHTDTQGPGIDEPLALLRSGTTSYYQADGLGSVTSLSNSSGALTSTNIYDSFGKLTSSSGTIVNPYRFAGRELDSETGLMYYRARYYDSATGRFISEDPIGLDGGQNFYAYVHNSTPGFGDPFGLAECKYEIQAHTMLCTSNSGGAPLPLGLGPNGVDSGADKGNQKCKNNNKCTDVKNIGPIQPGTYRMNADTRPEHRGWGLYRLEPWPHRWYDGLLYNLGLTRGGFELHLGSITYGCINADKFNPKAVEQYHQIQQLLQLEDGNNFLTVTP